MSGLTVLEREQLAAAFEFLDISGTGRVELGHAAALARRVIPPVALQLSSAVQLGCDVTSVDAARAFPDMLAQKAGISLLQLEKFIEAQLIEVKVPQQRRVYPPIHSGIYIVRQEFMLLDRCGEGELTARDIQMLFREV